MPFREVLYPVSRPRLFHIYWRCVALFFLASLLCPIHAQQGVAQAKKEHLPSFEVASIRADHSGNYSMSISVNSTRFTGKEIYTSTLLTIGFQVNDFQIVGTPGWARSEPYTVDARIPEETQKLAPSQEEKQIALMIRSLLINRYNLKYHRTTKILPVYSMVLSKKGPKLQNAKPDETTLETISNNTMTAHAYSMAELAKQLSLNLHRPVQDNTGLTGKYTFTLNYAPDHGSTIATGSPTDADLDNQARLLSALREDLGLKLVSQKGPVEVIVIDHLDRPSEN